MNSNISPPPCCISLPHSRLGFIVAKKPKMMTKANCKIGRIRASWDPDAISLELAPGVEFRSVAPGLIHLFHVMDQKCFETGGEPPAECVNRFIQSNDFANYYCPASHCKFTKQQ